MMSKVARKQLSLSKYFKVHMYQVIDTHTYQLSYRIHLTVVKKVFILGHILGYKCSETFFIVLDCFNDLFVKQV